MLFWPLAFLGARHLSGMLPLYTTGDFRDMSVSLGQYLPITHTGLAPQKTGLEGVKTGLPFLLLGLPCGRCGGF